MTHQEQITNLAMTIAWLTRSLHERDNTIATMHAAAQADLRELTQLRTVEKTALLVASKHGCRREMAAALAKVAPTVIHNCKVTFR